MLKRNNIPTGLLIGLILPLLSVLVFEAVMDSLWIVGKRGIPYFIVVGANLLVLRYFAAKHQEKTAQGIMLVTFAFMVAVYILRFR